MLVSCTLRLQDKKLTELDAALEGLVHVRYLDASKNALSQIKGFRSLRSLLSALLDENDLTELPVLGDLPYLQVVVANNNLITGLAGTRSDSLIQLSVNGVCRVWRRNTLPAPTHCHLLCILQRMQSKA